MRDSNFHGVGFDHVPQIGILSAFALLSDASSNLLWVHEDRVHEVLRLLEAPKPIAA